MLIHFLLILPLKKPSKFALTIFFKSSGIVHGLKKSELKRLLSSATKESYFILFNNILYKQIDGVAMESTLGPSLG